MLAEARIVDGAVVLSFSDYPISSCLCDAASHISPSQLNTVDGCEPGEFMFFWADGSQAPAKAAIVDNQVMVRLPGRMPTELRYAWRNNPSTGLLCNENGTMVSPLRVILNTLSRDKQ